MSLQVLKELNNKSFKELDRNLQKAFEKYGLQTIVITRILTLTLSLKSLRD